MTENKINKQLHISLGKYILISSYHSAGNRTNQSNPSKCDTEHITTIRLTFTNTATILAFMQKAIPDVGLTNRQTVTKADIIPEPVQIYWPVRYAALNLNVTTVSAWLQVCSGDKNQHIQILKTLGEQTAIQSSVAEATYSSACRRSWWLLREGSIPVHSWSLRERYGPGAGGHILEVKHIRISYRHVIMSDLLCLYWHSFSFHVVLSSKVES